MVRILRFQNLWNRHVKAHKLVNLQANQLVHQSIASQDNVKQSWFRLGQVAFAIFWAGIEELAENLSWFFSHICAIIQYLRGRAIHNVAKKIPWDVLDQAGHFLGLYDPVRWNGRPNPPLMSDCKGLESEVIRRMVKLVFSMPNIKSSFMCQMNPLISLSMSLFSAQPFGIRPIGLELWGIGQKISTFQHLLI